MLDDRPAVAVTGLGLVTPAGIGVSANWSTVLDAAPAATTDPALAGLPVDMSCRVPDFDADLLLGRRTSWRLDRYVQLALVAAREAIADADLEPAHWDGTRVGVVIGNALGGISSFERAHQGLLDDGVGAVSALLIPMMGVNMVAGCVAIDTGALGPNLVTSTACASGATAIGTALQLLRTGTCDVVIAGGVDACLTPTIVAGFTRMHALSTRCSDPVAASRPFDAGRDGFVIAEGAGVLVLERAEHARARGARVRAMLAGYGASADAFHATAPEPNGLGTERAVRAGLADAGLRPGDIDHVNAHGTSTGQGDVAEARMLRRVFGHRPAVTATKGVTGHLLGGAGAVEAAYTVLALQHQLAPPTANLDDPDPELDINVVRTSPRELSIAAAASNSFGFGGQNAVLIFTAA